MDGVARLESLYAALRAAGFAVGVAEVGRLHAVLRLQPRWPEIASGDRFKSILRSIVVKDRSRLAEFDRAVDGWLALQEPEDAVGMALPPSPGAAERAAPQRQARSGRWLVAFAFLALLPVLALLRADRAVEPAGASPEVVVIPPPPPPPPPERLTLEDLRRSSYLAHVPKLTVIPPQWQWGGWWESGLGLAALAATAGLAWAARRRRWFPDPEALPSRRGAPRIWLRQELPGAVMLDREEQQALVWGVDHFVGETPTRRLDLPATVRATARNGGIPVPCFRMARRQREVWLWLDESAEDPGLARLAEEIAQLLPAHGLSLETARFWGMPERLHTADGQQFQPREIEERLDLALVAVLTDGHELARRHRRDDRRVAVAALLRELSHWPRLWVVDGSGGASGLPALLAPYGVECIGPDRLAARIAGARRLRSGPRRPGDERVWAAACALAPAPVDEGSAWRLQRALQLRVSPWQMQELRQQAPGPGGLLQWSPPRRAALLNWLAAAEAQPGDGAATLLGRALEFWERVYRDEDRRRAGQQGAAWSDSPAQRHLAMEESLVRLWRHPAAAIRQLYALFQGPLQELIRQQLRQMACPLYPAQKPAAHGAEWSLPLGEGRVRAAAPDASVTSPQSQGRHGFVGLRWGRNPTYVDGRNQHGSGDRSGGPVIPATLAEGAELSIVLPWSWQERTGPERHMLAAMGFAGLEQTDVALRKPGRLWLGLGLAAGMGLAALALAITRPLTVDLVTRLSFEHGPGKPAAVWETSRSLAAGDWLGAVFTADGATETSAPIGSRVRVDWSTSMRPCVDDLGGGLERWHGGCATAARPREAAAGPRFAVLQTVIGGSPGDGALLLDLLRSGNADLMLTGMGAPDRLEALRIQDAALPAASQFLLVVSEPDAPTLVTDDATGRKVANQAWVPINPADPAALRFDGERPVREVWPAAHITAGNPSLFGLGKDESCRPHPVTDTVGDRTLNFIALCPGSFLMGSEGNAGDESPRHPVRIAAFAIGRDEVTFDEYDAFARATHRDLPNDRGWGRGRRPVIDVSWDDAQAYAQWLSRQTGKRYRLPTEAEWEYAARAGTQTEYWWGNEIRQDNKAWANCDGCGREWDNRQTAPVGSFPPNTFGLDDTAGNVWEWVQDCYHDDYRGAPGDGSAWEDGKNCGRRVIRGGSWGGRPVFLRSAFRSWNIPVDRNDILGFRLAQDF